MGAWTKNGNKMGHWCWWKCANVYEVATHSLLLPTLCMYDGATNSIEIDRRSHILNFKHNNIVSTYLNRAAAARGRTPWDVSSLVRRPTSPTFLVTNLQTPPWTRCSRQKSILWSTQKHKTFNWIQRSRHPTVQYQENATAWLGQMFIFLASISGAFPSAWM